MGPSLGPVRDDGPRSFAARLLAWFDRCGRRDLPWQHPRTPYRVWLSEVMLQQTQVETVIPAFQRFEARFPDVHALAEAPLDAVLDEWAGLGYYARARHLHRAAQRLAEAGVPTDRAGWEALPGVGRSTAAAICAQAYGQREAILDGNVKRWLARHAGIEGWPGAPAVTRALWAAAEARLPTPGSAAARRMADYTQATMDLGARCCHRRRPDCAQCPVADDCVARIEGRIETLPTPRPRRSRPEWQLGLWVLVDADGRVWFERRPASGVWGGLFALPERVDHAAADASGAPRGRPLPPGWRRAPELDAELRHELTHRRMVLRLSAWRWTALGLPWSDGLAFGREGRWLQPDRPAPGMPSPLADWWARYCERVAGARVSSAEASRAP